MELNNSTTMVDSSEKIFGLNAHESKEPTLENELLVPSTEFKAFTSMKNKQLVKEEIEIIDINCNESNVQEEMINESSMFSKQNFFNLEDTRIANFQNSIHQSQFINNTQASSNLFVNTASQNNDKVLINGRNLGPYLKVGKPLINYPCNKCSFVTLNESLLTQHNESVHVPKACPKCKLICENEKGFLLHYDQFCKSKDDIYECKRCKYQCKRISLLNLHSKLMHSPRKKAVNLTHHNSSQNVIPNNLPKTIIFVTAKSLYSRNDNNVIEQDNTVNSLCSIDQRSIIDQNNVVNSLLSIDSDNSVEKDCFEEEKVIFETKNMPVNHPNINCQTNIAEGYYCCLKCDFKSPSKWTVRSHCEKHHPEISDPLGSNNESEYIEYRALENTKQETYNPLIKCKICDTHFEHSVDLNSHVTNCRRIPYFSKRIKQNIPKENSVLRPSVCEQCGRRFTNSVYLERHWSFCMLTFFCHDCLFRTKSKTELRNHIKLDHLNVCSVNENCLSKPFRRQSQKTHQSLQCYCMNCSQRYAVELCAKKCRKCKKFLHFRCQICGNTFKQNDVQACEHVKKFLTKLDMQTYNSSKIKKYQCNDCPYEVGPNRLYYLKKHILKLHVKNRNTPCTKCNWDFESRSGLQKHLAYCGRKLSMECKVILTKIKTGSVDLPISIKQKNG